MGRRVSGPIQRAKQDAEAVSMAVTMLRTPASAIPGLAATLCGLLRLRASILATDGWYDDALVDVEEALRISRRTKMIGRASADLHTAAALSLRAHVLRCSNRQREAVDDAQQSLALCRARLSHAPHRFGPLLLNALDELAHALNETGEPAQALPLAEEAVRILRRLAPHRPCYEPDLAGALHQLGVYLSDLGELTRALHATNESLQLFLRLDAQKPESFVLQVELATYNRNLFLDRVNKQE